MGIPLSLRDYAKHRRSRGLPGGTHQAVRKAIARRAITTDAAGRIDPDVADVAWSQNSDESARRNFEQEPAQARTALEAVAAEDAAPAAPAPVPPPEPAWIARPEPLPAPPVAVPVVPAPAAVPAAVAGMTRPRGRQVAPTEPHAAVTPPTVERPSPDRDAPEPSVELAAAERTRGTVASAAADLKRVQVRLAELKLAEYRGELVRADEVRRGWAELILGARNRLLGIAAGFRTRCPHVDPESVRVLEGMIRDVLQDLAAAGAREGAGAEE